MTVLLAEGHAQDLAVAQPDPSRPFDVQGVQPFRVVHPGDRPSGGESMPLDFLASEVRNDAIAAAPDANLAVAQTGGDRSDGEPVHLRVAVPRPGRDVFVQR